MNVDKSDNPVGDVKEEKTEVGKPVVLLSGLDDTERKQQLPPGCRRVKSSPLVVSRSA